MWAFLCQDFQASRNYIVTKFQLYIQHEKKTKNGRGLGTHLRFLKYYQFKEENNCHSLCLQERLSEVFNFQIPIYDHQIKY